MNQTLFASIFGTVSDAPCVAIQEVSESSDFDFSDDEDEAELEVEYTVLQDLNHTHIPSAPDIISALKRIDAVQFMLLTQTQHEELLGTLLVQELGAGQDLTVKDAPAEGLYVVISEGPALVDDATGEIASSGAIVDIETIMYNATVCRCSMKAGTDGCTVAFLPKSNFSMWKEIRARLLYEAVPLFRTVSIERLHCLQVTHEYADPDTVIHGILVITSGVVIVKSDGPEARLFPGHIMGVREMFEKEQSEGLAETRVGAARLLEKEVTALMQEEMNFMMAVGETIFQRCVVTEARMKRASDEDVHIAVVSSPVPPGRGGLSRTQSVLKQSTIVWERKAVLRRNDKNQSFINEYCIFRRLGTGATAAVYLCGTQQPDNKEIEHVAVKVVVRDRTGHCLQREIDALKNLTHPNIISLLKIIDDPKCDKVFLVEEFAQGGSMMGVTLNLKDGQKCAADCLSALHYMHRKGYVHRDIKPANLVRMLDGTVKLADFGCAIKVGREEHVAFAGTPAFTSPEICIGAKVTPAVDVWALTATLHCIMYGKPPFSSYRRVELEDEIRYNAPRLGSGYMASFTADEISPVL
jgi:CRP-like cAMP-binding protein